MQGNNLQATPAHHGGVGVFYPFVTFFLIFLNLAVYLSGYAWTFALDDLAYAPWKLLAYQASHANIAHVMGNCMFLCMVGPSCEKRVGSGIYAAIYVLAGALGALGSTLVAGGAVFLIGSSISIAGLMMMYPLAQRTWVGRVLGGVCLGFWFYMEFIGGLYNLLLMPDGTDHMGHVAGGVVGLVLFSLFLLWEAHDKRV